MFKTYSIELFLYWFKQIPNTSIQWRLDFKQIMIGKQISNNELLFQFYLFIQNLLWVGKVCCKINVSTEICNCLIFHSLNTFCIQLCRYKLRKENINRHNIQSWKRNKCKSMILSFLRRHKTIYHEMFDLQSVNFLLL